MRDLDGGRVSPSTRDLRWQAEVWRRVAADVGAPSPTERHREVVAAIVGGAALPLPDRLSLFGHTRLTPTDLDLVRAVGRVRDVHLWLPTPSPVLWDRLLAEVALGPVRRRLDASAPWSTHPLLATLGRDSRELQRSLTGLLGASEPMLPTTADEDPAQPPAQLSAGLAAARHPDRLRARRRAAPTSPAVRG